MVIISKAILSNFITYYPDAKGAVEQWYAVTKEVTFKK
jgi:hypothetical protein